MNEGAGRGSADRLSPGAMRVAVIGSCQAAGLAGWIRLLLPAATVDGWHVGTARSSPDAILHYLSATDTHGGVRPGYDLIITQIEDHEHDGQLAIATLRRLCPIVVFLPILVFRGFHPDRLQCFQEDGTHFVLPSLGLFHPAIVAAAVRLRIPAAGVPALFNNLVFRTAGYHTVFAGARDALLASFAAHGYDLAAPFEDWMRDGAFMYTDNHPRIRVLGSLARQVLGKAKFAMAEVTTPPVDTLEESVKWPIYPSLARALGVAGADSFGRAAHEVLPGESRDMGLDAWVAEAYCGYAAAGSLAFYPTWVLDNTIAALEELAVGA